MAIAAQFRFTGSTVGGQEVTVLLLAAKIVLAFIEIILQNY
ncbi:hypothetical protein [Bacterioplanoides sp. SCSIO 12839]|nr:hypothetical protein [Bacterioplanoides sp. SCSIO 12839]